MRQIYFTKVATYKVSEQKPYLVITEEDVITKKKYYIEDRFAAMTIADGCAKPYVVEEIVKEETAKPTWKMYLERQGANTLEEKAYLTDLCVRLGVPAEDVDGYKRKDFRKVLEDAEKEKPNVLQSVINGNMDLSEPKTVDETVEDIFNGTDDTDSYANILNGE